MSIRVSEAGTGENCGFKNIQPQLWRSLPIAEHDKEQTSVLAFTTHCHYQRKNQILQIASSKNTSYDEVKELIALLAQANKPSVAMTFQMKDVKDYFIDEGFSIKIVHSKYLLHRPVTMSPSWSFSMFQITTQKAGATQYPRASRARTARVRKSALSHHQLQSPLRRTFFEMFA